MDCPNCGTYNPEDREVCWRCDQPLPKPKPRKKRRDPQQSARVWLYVAIAVFAIFTLLQTCGVRLPFGPQMPQQQEPSGYVPLPPGIVYQVEAPWML